MTITASGRATFGSRCTSCPLRTRCTRAKNGKLLKIHPNHDQLAAARRDANDDAWQAFYRQQRPMVESTIAWLVARGHRRVRFRGIDANHPWLAHRAAPVNLKRPLALGLEHNHGHWTLPAPA